MVRRVWVAIKLRFESYGDLIIPDIDFAEFDELEQALGYKKIMEDLGRGKVIVLEGCTYEEFEDKIDQPKDVVEIEDFRELIPILRSSKNVLIGFYSSWCEHYSTMLDDLSKEVKNVRFVKVNIDKAKDLAYIFGIKSVPTAILVKMDELAGDKDKKTLKNWILRQLS